MAYLQTYIPGSEPIILKLQKRLTSMGKGPDADIILADDILEPIAAYINQADGVFTLIVPPKKQPALFDKKPERKKVLEDGCSFKLGNACVEFFCQSPQRDLPELKAENGTTKAYRRLLDFSQKIACETDMEALLATLLREITQLTNAEHGFLVLLEKGKPVIKVRELPKHTSFDQITPMSDSIVKKVLETKEAIIIRDALHDQEFSSSLSVINYRLSSVMCAPLNYQGHIFGAIYVGNNSFVDAFNTDSLELMTIYSSQAAMLVQNALHISALKKQTKFLKESLELAKFGGIIGSCHSMQQVFSQVEKVAPTNISVLICGETGTGKELIARELHDRSPRKNGPFVVINCGAIPENLLESELFGHVRGAFTGATASRIGKFQAAHTGTLFLDEIGEMPIHLQVKLLRALQDHKVSRLGETTSQSVNIRILAATNRDLTQMVQNNIFREDLYYRLNVVQITLPPLRERGNDVLVIANYYLQKYTKIYNKNILGLDEAAQNALLNFYWPGNVRQLENRIKRAIVMCDHDRIDPRDLDLQSEASIHVLSLSQALDRYRRKYIQDSLERNAGNRTKTATELGIDPRTVFRHLENIKKEPGEQS